MIPQPLIRSNVCVTAHPSGCAEAVRRQVDYIRRQPVISHGPGSVLVLGASTGYGLASRITAAFGCNAYTVGVSLERPGRHERPGSPGWYNNRAFDRLACEANLPSLTIEGDAFSDDLKGRVVAALRAAGRRLDLVVYSVVSPMRTDPRDGTIRRLAIKPVGASYNGLTLDVAEGTLAPVTLEPATEQEIHDTVNVMGGGDWGGWIDQLMAADVLNTGCRTLAYSYIGPASSHAIYRHGTLGRAKEHLEQTALELNNRLEHIGGGAWVSVNKALVTRASAVIPVVPLSIAALLKVMKRKGLHEGCIEQVARLFRTRLYAGGCVPVDEAGRIRMDDWELRDDVQAETARCLADVTPDNFKELTDWPGFLSDFLQACGFAVPGVDYTADVAMD